MESQPSGKTLGLRRFYQRPRKKYDTVRHTTCEISGSDAHLKQKLDQTDSYSSHFSYRRDEAPLAIVGERSNSKHPHTQDVSDGPLDDDAIEFTSDNPNVYHSMLEEHRQGYDAAIAVVEGTENNAYTECSTAAYRYPTTSPLTHHILPLSIPTSYDFYALDAYTSDPLPFHLMSPGVLELAAHQLSYFDLSNLNGQRCLQQHYRGLRTDRWYMESKSDKFACEGCSMVIGRVCMRWLVGNAFVILPLVPNFRDVGARSEDAEY